MLRNIVSGFLLGRVWDKYIEDNMNGGSGNADDPNTVAMSVGCIRFLDIDLI
jgi:hypothetical protein